jgi:hypothetical protein
LSLSGTDAFNYVLSAGMATTTADITARAITVTADAQVKVYGDTDPALTWQIASGLLVSGDSITGSLSRVAGEAVGSYPILQDTLTAGTNYNLTYVEANLTITPASSALALVATPNPSFQSSNVTFTATVSPVAPANSIPTGSVQFYANDTALGNPVALTEGIASLITADLPIGTNTVLAAYLGDGNYVGSTNSLAQVVSLNAESPLTLGIAVNKDGTVTVTFAGTQGAQYVVQACASIAAPVWQIVSTNVADAQGHWTFTDTPGVLQQRFYRAATP